MNDNAAPSEELAPIIIDRQVAKGRGILEICLERGKNLGMKGFIDCQIESGGHYLQVVEVLIEHISLRLAMSESSSQKALLRDLLEYADARLLEVQAIPDPLEV